MTYTYDLDTHLIYQRVATEFAHRIRSIFATEDSLKAVHARYFERLPFDRTERWNVILGRELREVWDQFGLEVKAAPTKWDIQEILGLFYGQIDFNLFSQVYLNLQTTGTPCYRLPEEVRTSVTNEIRDRWEDQNPSPLDPKAKMFKTPTTVEEQRYNRDLSTIKAMALLQARGLGQSFRVTPIGSTPALTDSANLSMLGIGADRFLVVPPGLQVFYLTWDETPVLAVPTPDAKFFASPYVSYVFGSKSGGEVLNASLYARLIMTRMYGLLSHDRSRLCLLPRINSVLVMTSLSKEDVAWAISHLLYADGIDLSEGVRPDKPLAAPGEGNGSSIPTSEPPL